MFCTKDCFQVHPFIVDIIIKSDTSAIKNIVYRISQICKRANIRGGFNFAMFAVDYFPAKLKPPRSFYNTFVYSYLLLHVRNP